jgi:hypothetical protein
MSSLFRQVLAFTCSVLVALPPGWCCFIETSPCCQTQTPPKKEQPADPPPCCCCHHQAGAEEHVSDVPAQPSAPQKLCCCEPTPSALPRIEKFSADLTAVLLPLPVEAPTVFSVSVPTGPGSLLSSSPPLHVLQCVWRC